MIVPRIVIGLAVTYVVVEESKRHAWAGFDCERLKIMGKILGYALGDREWLLRRVSQAGNLVCLSRL